ncbi:MAG: dihydropteroate synthase [Planctomycetota bacterium]|jgi:dihydropteroate synthase|nr:dihydropteroate synthase [Planctomycetota bacterium]
MNVAETEAEDGGEAVNTVNVVEQVCEFPRARPIRLGRRTLVMGIVNMTPDSFSGQNAAGSAPAAVDMALAMLGAGADMIDMGAESSRPGAAALDWKQETDRLGDVVARLREKTDAPISVDTYHPETAAYVLDQGADIINDIAALRGGWGDDAQSGMAGAVARAGAVVVLMHMKGAPGVMQDAPSYDRDVVEEVRGFLAERAAFARAGGIGAERIWLDPGFGFGKNFDHNRALLLRLGEIADVGYPVLVGMSRKRMIGDALGRDAGERLEGSLALAVMGALHGASVVRAHDVLETARAVRMVDAVRWGIRGCRG